MSSPPGGGHSDWLPELHDLLDRLQDGDFTESDRLRLNELLQSGPAQRQYFITYMDVHSRLCWEGGRETRDQLPHQPDAASPEPLIPPIIIDTSAPAEPPRFSTLFAPGGWLFSYAAATVITGMLVLGAWVYKVSVENSRGLTDPGNAVANGTSSGAVSPRLKEPELVGRITGTTDCRWADPDVAPAGAAVRLGGTYALASGLLEISYDAGARVILQGPCTYEVDSRRGGFLALGKLTARVERSEVRDRGSGARGQGSDHYPLATSHYPLFFVRTPTAVVTDLGTEFGVEVERSGATRSRVFRGKVEVRTAVGGESDSRAVSLAAGESIRVELGQDHLAKVVLEPPQPHGFVRQMPGRLPNKLISYWNFDEGAGKIAHNAGLAGKKFDGTLMAAAKTGPGTLPVWVPGRFGRALDFTGSTVFTYPDPVTSWSVNYVKVAGGGGLQFENNVSVSLWVKWNGPQPAAIGIGPGGPSNTLGHYGCVLGRQLAMHDTNAIGLNYNGDPATCSGLRLTPGGVSGWTEGHNTAADAGGSFAIGSAPPGDQTWVHLVLVVDGGTFAMYENGRLVRTLNGLDPLRDSGPLTIGALFAAGDVCGPSNSTVDDVGVFEETLSEGKARAIFTIPALPELKDYDLGKVNALFGVYDSAGPDASVAIGPLVWQKAAGLTGHNAGDAWAAGGKYFVQLDPSGGGVVGEREE